MTSHSALESHVSRGRELVEARLLEIASSPDVRAARATTHLLEAGGKRLRPTLVLTTAMLGPNPEADAVIDAGVGIELTHLASLYHDDVMDEAAVRRGVPAAQEVFGNRVAIMAGDVLFASASGVIAGLGDRAVQSHSKAFWRLCLGQLHESMGPEEGASRRDHYIGVLADKTASLLAEAAREGVYAAGGTEADAEIVAEFGEKVGVAFQLADDYIDIMVDGETTGKTPGTDLREGVDTMPTIMLRERAADGSLDEPGRRALDLIQNGNLDDDATLAEAVAALRASSVMEATRALAKQWADEGIAAISGLKDEGVREALEEFARHAVDRSA